MGWLSFLILGLIAGAIARLILPGKQRGGILVTLLLGVIGAMLGGWLAGFIFPGNDFYNAFFSWQAWLTAIIGAVVVLLIYGAITGGRRRRA